MHGSVRVVSLNRKKEHLVRLQGRVKSNGIAESSFGRWVCNQLTLNCLSVCVSTVNRYFRETNCKTCQDNESEFCKIFPTKPIKALFYKCFSYP